MTRRCVVALVVLALVALPPTAGAGEAIVLAGAAAIDSTWHVGASAGQYASDGFAVGSHGLDPHTHQTRRAPSYGIQSREWARALVVQGPDGERWALVTNDLYIPQDLVNRRVAGILEEHDRLVDLGLLPGRLRTGITDANMTISVSHSHSSPYYSTPSWGVWAFQDVFDVRFFEHIAQKMADAVIAAAQELTPVRMGASVSYFNRFQRHSFGATVADDGTPAGFPETDFGDNRTVARTENEETVTVLRFDDVRDPAAPQPLATWVVYGLHPEMLDGNDLLTGEYVNTMYRFVDREIGGVTLFSQHDTGTAEPAQSARTYPPSERLEFSHREYAQMERGARALADVVEDTWRDIGAGTPEEAGFFVPLQEGFEVSVSDIRFAPPSLRGTASVSNCRMEKTFDGNPGIPVLGLPDCEYPFGGTTGPIVQQSPVDPGVTYETLREAGIPVPDNVSAPSYTGLEETLQVHLQAIRLGPVAVTVCPCEQWADQARNIRTRLNRAQGDIWHGFDWTEHRTPAGRDWCVQNDDTTWTCADPRGFRPWFSEGTLIADLPPVPDERYRRMRAQIHNDAAGWEDLAYTPYAETEEVDIERIKGNFTHEEVPASQAYDLVVPIGMTNDYWGYIASYREYQRGDHYRKALTGLGPHSSDFLATRLVRMAASLNGGPLVALGPKDVAYSPENEHEYQRAQVIGNATRAYLAAYESQLPPDGGTPHIAQEPTDLRTGTARVVGMFSAAHVRWVGGSNYADTPNARVERCVASCDDRSEAEWAPFADGSGEVQLKVTYPQTGDVPAYRAGSFVWNWEATFETFRSDIPLTWADGTRAYGTPPGWYRFVISGERRAPPAGAVVPYHLASLPFHVLPWDGVTATDLRVEEDGTVSFLPGPIGSIAYKTARLGTVTYTIGPLDYPDTYPSPFRFIQPRTAAGNLREYDQSTLADDQLFCFECSFRPWADTGTLVQAQVVVERPDGTRFGVDAFGQPDGRWRTAYALAPGEFASVPAGRLVDAFGETNAEPSATVAHA